ncbi:MAG: arginyltransferase [Gammaproteobacteria bacterium]|nr:arginyltransferase [Gammaproteobacteria bacterium]
MTEPPSAPRLGFFTSPPHECGYLPQREAVTMFADPRINLSVDAYTWLSAHGFRRSGTHVYRPHCADCSACIPVRIAVPEFALNRAQRRTLARNTDVEFHARAPRFEREHFHLYERYLRARHPDSHMDSTNPSAYMSFLTALWCDTTFYEFRCGEELLAVAVVDRLGDGLSSVYTFFAPDQAERSLGRLAVLKQVEWAAALGLPWVYLGYWIRDCRKMAYKDEYAPLEFYINGEWTRNVERA